MEVFQKERKKLKGSKERRERGKEGERIGGKEQKRKHWPEIFKYIMVKLRKV